MAGPSGPQPQSAVGGPLPTASPSTAALPFDDAVDQMTVALFANARLGEASGRSLVIDPLIDEASGNELVATRSMERRMTDVVRARFPGIEPRPFTSGILASRPLVLLGSITPVAGPGVMPTTIAPTKTYRIWAVIADLSTNRILSHESAWVRPDGVDMAPTQFFRDSPSWLADGSQAAYIKTCGSKPGEEIDPTYMKGLLAGAAISDGIRAYEAGQYGNAVTLLTSAGAAPQGDQLRVYNGLYLSNAALGRQRPAEAAFGHLVDYGIQRGKLAVKFVFRPNATQFWPDPAISGAYPMWLRQIAARMEADAACLRLVGHTSPTGPAALNQTLSFARADTVRSLLVGRAAGLAGKTNAEGHGSTEPIVGSGRDDATDVLDRRVEFIARPCSPPNAMGRTATD